MATSPFTLYVKQLKNGPVWYARFTNPENKNVYITRSTGIPFAGKKGRKTEAFAAAQAMVDSIPKTDRDPLLLEYLVAFWSEGSPYIRSKIISDRKPLSKYYIEQNLKGIVKHVVPFKRFQKVHLSELKSGMIEDWKLWKLEDGLGGRRLNAILQSMRVAVRWAWEREEIPRDPFIHIKGARFESREKGILNRKELQSLLNVRDTDKRITLAVQLAVLCGLRRGEVRGLRWGDIDLEERLIHIKHNWINEEGTKSCKWGSDRTVILPDTMKPLFIEMKNISAYTENEDFVLFGIKTRLEPISNATIRGGFVRMLRTSGISNEQQTARNLTFHGMRHTFVSLARAAGIPDIIVQNLAGHKSAEMMDHYSHGGQVIDFNEARKKLEDMQNEKVI